MNRLAIAFWLSLILGLGGFAAPANADWWWDENDEYADFDSDFDYWESDVWSEDEWGRYDEDFDWDLDGDDDFEAWYDDVDDDWDDDWDDWDDYDDDTWL